MADLTAGFETGVDGATIATSDAGDASAWDAVVGAPKYSNTHAQDGALSGKVLNGTNDYLMWALPNPTDHYGRIYIYITGNAGAFPRILYLRKASTVVAAILFSIGTTRLLIQDKGGAHETTMTNGIATNQWVRIEWHVVHSATVGQIEVKFFNNPESTTPTEVFTSPASWDTDTLADEFNIGVPSGSMGSDIWFDDIVANATAYPGPVPSDVVVPQVLSMLAHVSGHSVW